MDSTPQKDAKVKTNEVPEIKAEDIKYVAVEMINKDDRDASAVIAGLFKGVKIRKNETTAADETFFMVHDEKDSTFVLNNEFHNVISIEILSEADKAMTYFMMTEEDQITAASMLSNIIKDLAKKKMVLENDSTMVDISKFKDVPENILKGNSTATKAGAHKAGASTYSSTKIGTNTPYTPVAPYVRKESTPHLWKRRSRKPTKEALMTLALKVSAIETGKLKIKIPKLPEDDENIKPTAVCADTLEDEGHNYPYGGIM